MLIRCWNGVAFENSELTENFVGNWADWKVWAKESLVKVGCELIWSTGGIAFALIRLD